MPIKFIPAFSPINDFFLRRKRSHYEKGPWNYAEFHFLLVIKLNGLKNKFANGKFSDEKRAVLLAIMREEHRIIGSRIQRALSQ